MPYKQATTLDFPGSHLPTRDTVLGGGAPAPSDGNPGPLHPASGLERGVSSAYRGLGGQEGPGAPSGEEVPHNQTGPGTVDMSSPARAWSLDRPSQDGLLICHDETIPAHKVLLSSTSFLHPSGSYILPSSTSSSTTSSSPPSSSSSPEDELQVELAAIPPTAPPVLLKTSLEKCPVCLIGDLVEVKRPKSDMIIYGKRGMKLAEHKEHRCSNKNQLNPCRVGAYHGYITHQGNKIYMPDCLKNDVLVVSNQTAFEIDYLIEIVADIYILQGCFESIAKKFNRLNNRHLPTATLERRTEVCRKRITSGFFLFSFLEYGQRYGVSEWQLVRDGNLEETVMERKDELQKSFQERWTKSHKCDKPGCEGVVIIDGDLKPHRMLCAAKLCGVREFENSDVRVVTGCTAHPGTKHKFCFKHRSEESPILTEDKISQESRDKLKNHRKNNAASDKAPKDQLYIIESIAKIEVKKNKEDKFLVKWSGFPEEASTWEPAANVPKFIRDYYKGDSSRLNTKLPNPTIKHTKTVGNTKYHFLSWDGSKGGEWLKDDFFDIIDEKGETVTVTQEEICNTRKSRDKRTRAHTVGLFVAVKPCGTVVLFDELYGSESISQVYGIMIDWLGNLSDMSSIEIVLYDDNCHLGAYSENKERASKNEVTKHFASLGKYIDKFHFPNHVGKTCQNDRDPYKIKALDNVNTQAAEQLFRDVNKHTNCQAMSESHFYLFWLYIMDLHNLSISGLDRVEPDPREDYRDIVTKVNNMDLTALRKDLTNSSNIESNVESTKQSVSTFTCTVCGSSFKREGNLKNHIQKIHEGNIKPLPEQKKPIEKTNSDSVKVDSNNSNMSKSNQFCELCSHPFGSALTLQNHIKKKHLTCSICKKLFDTEPEMELCRAQHTTCNICQFNAKFPAKLKRHMESHR